MTRNWIAGPLKIDDPALIIHYWRAMHRRVVHGFSRGGRESADHSCPPPLKRWATHPGGDPSNQLRRSTGLHAH